MVATAAAVNARASYLAAQHSRKMYEIETKVDQTLLERRLKTNHQSETQQIKSEYERQIEELKTQVQKKKEAALAAAVERVVPVAQAAPAPTPQPTGSCVDMIRAAGISDVGNALWLINKESGCRTTAINKTSGACGIPQALPCSKLGTARGNAIAEIQWMNSYVIRRYGSWANAVAFHRANNWY